MNSPNINIDFSVYCQDKPITLKCNFKYISDNYIK